MKGASKEIVKDPRSCGLWREEEGTVGVTHLLADAIEEWGNDESDSSLIAYARKLREIAGPLLD